MTDADTLAASLAAARLSSRISGSRASYRKDNPGEYVKVLAYLDGGARPSGALTHMGEHLVLEEDVRRGLARNPPIASSGLTTPPAIAGQSYRLVLAENFDQPLDLNFWRRSIWYEAEDNGTNVFVSNGVLNLVSRQSDLYPSHHLMTRTQAYQYGYFEARMRYTHDAQSFPAWWMMSDNWMRTGDCTTLKISEWDMFEGFDTNFPRSHSGALHQNTTGACGLADALNSNWTNDCGFDLGYNWRTYAGLWTSAEVRFYVDDTEMTGERFNVFSTTNQPMRPILQTDTHGSGTATTYTTEVDWVRIWQK